MAWGRSPAEPESEPQKIEDDLQALSGNECEWAAAGLKRLEESLSKHSAFDAFYAEWQKKSPRHL